jgi:hypothetical protein
MGWLDVFVGALIAAFGIALAVVLIVGGGSLLQMLLVIGLFAAVAVGWLRTSWGWDTLRRRR